MYYTLMIMQCFLALAITALVLLQPTEGGALGIGESEGILKGQPTVNPLVRVTVLVGGLFFITCLSVSVAQNWLRPAFLGEEPQEGFSLPKLPSLPPAPSVIPESVVPESVIPEPSVIPEREFFQEAPSFPSEQKNKNLLEEVLPPSSPFLETP